MTHLLKTHKAGLLVKSSIFSSLAIALTLLLLPPDSSSIYAAEFEGALKGVTISDTSTSNSPPTAAFTYTIEGTTVSFDANQSSDSDGTLTAYKWDFGSGNTAEGVTTSYTIAEGQTLQVTLTVIDNENGVALRQEIISSVQQPPSTGIYDDFSTDTTANYTAIYGNFNHLNTSMHGQNWRFTKAYHQQDLLSKNHSVSANITYNGQSDSGGVIARANPTTGSGYCFVLTNGTGVIYAYTGQNNTWIASSNTGGLPAGTYNLRLEVTDNSIRGYIDDSLVINIQDTSVQEGSHIGFAIKRDHQNDDVIVDSITGSID